MPVDLVNVSLQNLVNALAKQELSSEQLVGKYLDRIEADNLSGKGLRAIIETPPRDDLLRIARGLDEQRRNGEVKSVLHGTPVVISDAIAVHPDLKMETTAGTKALVGCKPIRNAKVVDNLLAAGAIIIGKGNMTTLNNYLGPHCIDGWSPRGGQVVHPQSKDFPVWGASTGCASALLAGFCGLAIGNEHCGALMYPCKAHGVFGLKPSRGLVSTEGVIKLSERQGCVGPVGKSAWDLALGLSALTGFKIDYTASLAENQQFRVGIVRGNYWLDDPKDNPSLASEHEKILGDTVSKITQVLDVKVDNLACEMFPQFYEGSQTGDDIGAILLTHEGADAIDGYLSKVQGGQVKTLADLIKWQEEHPESSFPAHLQNESDVQDTLKLALKTQHADNTPYISALNKLAELTVQITQLLDDNGLDALVLGGGDYQSPASSVFATGGLPLGVMPCGQTDDGRPYPLYVLGRRGSDDKVLAIMNAIEGVVPPRPIPASLLD